MSNRPGSRSRFEVPISQRNAPKRHRRDRGSSRKSSGFANENNRTFVNAGVLAGATVITTVFLLAISGQIYDTTNANLVPRSPAPLIGSINSIATPSPSSTRSPRALSTPSPEPEATPVETPDDTEIQAAIDTKLGGDGSLAGLGITATVNEGKVILVGTAPTDELKGRVERLVRSVRGVKQVDNQIAVVIDN